MIQRSSCWNVQKARNDFGMQGPGKTSIQSEIELVPGEGAECVKDTQAGAKGTPKEGGLRPGRWHQM